MSKHWKEKYDPSKHPNEMYVHKGDNGFLNWQEKNGNEEYQTDEVYFVRVCSFTFIFMTLEQLEEALVFFSRPFTGSTRLPGSPRKEEDYSRWYERLPKGMTSKKSREKVTIALKKALLEFGSNKALKGA